MINHHGLEDLLLFSCFMPHSWMEKIANNTVRNIILQLPKGCYSSNVNMSKRLSFYSKLDWYVSVEEKKAGVDSTIRRIESLLCLYDDYDLRSEYTANLWKKNLNQFTNLEMRPKQTWLHSSRLTILEKKEARAAKRLFLTLEWHFNLIRLKGVNEKLAFYSLPYALQNNLDIRIANIIQDEESNMSPVLARALSFLLSSTKYVLKCASPAVCVFILSLLGTSSHIIPLASHRHKSQVVSREPDTGLFQLLLTRRNL